MQNNMLNDSEYGFDYRENSSTTLKTDQNASDYKIVSEHERVFMRPHIYAGSIERTPRKLSVFDGNNILLKTIETPKCLERFFLEIFSNSTDNITKSRDQGVTADDIFITMDRETISIRSGGLPMPLSPHPTLCVNGGFGTVLDLFGILGSGTNLDDNFARGTGGQNGLGAKLCNIFSRLFLVEAGDNIRGIYQVAQWTKNMKNKCFSQCTPPYIKHNGQWYINGEPYKGENFVKTTWKQDFRKFKCNGYSIEEFELYMKYAVCSSFASKVKIHFNEKCFDYRDINNFVKLFSNPSSFKSKVVYNHFSVEPKCDPKEIPKLVSTGLLMPDIELCILDAPDAGFHMSFTNSIYNELGGVHTDECYRNALILIKKILLEDKSFAMTKEEIDKLDIKTMKKHTILIVNFRCLNPGFSNQEKEKLVNPKPKFNIPISFIKQMKSWKMLECIYMNSETKKVKKVSKKRTVTYNFQDANLVGKKGVETILLPCEGLSAGGYIDRYILLKKLPQGIKSGRDIFAGYPMRGKIKNSSGMSIKEMDLANKDGSENELVKFMFTVGLQDGVDYTTREGADTLRYKFVWVMVDADSDGSHILCLLVNFLFRRFPSFLKAGRLRWVLTPIMRVMDTNENTIERFYNVSDYKAWKIANPNVKHETGYYKGLASSSPDQVKEDAIFSPTPVLYFDNEADIYLKIAFDQTEGCSDKRKEWIKFYKDFIDNNIMENNNQIVRISNVVNVKLVEYSLDTLFRALPSYKDLLKLSYRQLMAYLIEKYNFGLGAKKPRTKIAIIAAGTIEMCKYQHGDLVPTLTKFALDYAGSNNLSFIENSGMFGSRAKLGTDCGAGRYIETRPEWWIPYLIKKELYNLVPKNVVEGKEVEPKWIPFLLPLGVINGIRGVATAWSCRMTNHHPMDVCEWVLRYISGQDVFPIIPWYRGFTGNVTLETTKRTIADTDGGDDYDSISCRTDGIYRIYNERKQEVTVEEENEITGVMEKKKKIMDVCDIDISEVPIGVSSVKLQVDLQENSDDAACVETVFNSPAIKCVGYRGIPKPEDIQMTSKFGITNFSTVDDNGVPVVFRNIYQVIVSYCNNMIELFNTLKNTKIENLTKEIKDLQMKLFLVNRMESGEFAYRDIEDEIIHAELEKLTIPIKIFDSITVKNQTKKGRAALEKKLSDDTIELERIIKSDPLETWKNDLQIFYNELSKRQEYKKLPIHDYPKKYMNVNELLSGRVIFA